ncbi:MAG TPA: hypothetical protein VM184_10240 [Gaiellaceae bacterium]|nr:hypothetical protein [Gaiellaceae bacterium]
MTSRVGPSIAAALVLAAVAGALVVVLTRDGGIDPRLGVNTHLVWEPESEARAGFAAARAGRIEWVREELPWREVEPEAGRWSWERTDGLMAAAAAARVNVLGILAYSAPWASSDPGGDGRYPPADPAAYARYAAEVVERYGPDGGFWEERPDLDPRPLLAVEIWNEPFSHLSWRPEPDPAAYARLARAAAEAIHAVSDEVEILVAGDLLQVRADGAVVPWLVHLREADEGLASLVAAYSVHPYPDPRTLGPYDDRSDPRWDFRRVEVIHDLDPRLPIWITEIGWATARTADSVSEARQAEYVAGAVERALGEWSEYVERIFVYSFDRDGEDAQDREEHYGLRRADGSAKPAWEALQRLDTDELPPAGG